ncbi:MAG: hypothetical protein D4R79_00285 [Comamonadaceae bacterium]|nr:MAG: hypothetical protein D4R79_00285 [Comamonadaceae bacterium]
MAMGGGGWSSTQPSPDLRGFQDVAGADGQIAIVVLFNLLAEEVHQTEFTGDPRTSRHRVNAGTLFRREFARQFGAVAQQESLVVLNGVPCRCTGDPITQIGFGGSLAWDIDCRQREGLGIGRQTQVGLGDFKKSVGG